MGKALNKNILSIRLELSDFSIQDIVNKQKEKLGWTISNKILVFGCSQMILNKFVKNIINDEYNGNRNNITMVNEKYYFSISYLSFLSNKKFYENVMIINSIEFNDDLVFGSTDENDDFRKLTKKLLEKNRKFAKFCVDSYLEF